jgi:Family of unknown function (DUF6448)
VDISKIARMIAVAAGLGFFALLPARALAHCDGLDGPVVKAAQRALDTRNPALVLIWVQEKDEPEIRKAFEQTLAVRELSPQARELADGFFFETLVRVHRAGEGAPFTGLKPAGRDLGPAIPAADEAVRVGSVEPVRHLLRMAIHERLRHQFGEVMGTKTFEPMMSLPHVKAYVEFIHFVERLYDSTMKTPHGHFEKSEALAKQHDRGSLGGQLKTGNLWTGQNRQFPARPRPVSSTSFPRPCANRSAPLVRQLRGPHLSTCA